MGKKKMKKLTRATTYPAMKKRSDKHLLPKSGFKGQKESFEKLKLKKMPVKIVARIYITQARLE